MDFLYYNAMNAEIPAPPPIKQIEALTTPVRKTRAPLIRTISSPVYSYGLPECVTPMSRRDSVSSFTSSIDNWPMTPMTEEYVTPEMLYRSSSLMGSSSSNRPRSSTAGSMSSHPYYPSSNAVRMQRRHTSMGDAAELAGGQWSALTPYGPHSYTPQTPSQSAAWSAIHSATSTPMQPQLSSPLSEIGAQQMSRLNVRGDALPLIVSSMDKAHVCPHCNKRFKRLEHVKRHERAHTHEKPFACSFDGCGRNFSRSDNLKAHEKTHFKKGRNYRMMQKKMGSSSSEEMTAAAAAGAGVAAGSLPMSANPSDEGLGESEEYEAEQQHKSSIATEVTLPSQPLSPGQYLSFSLLDYEEHKPYAIFASDDFTL